uniref:Uncharacterized protein n=1 Tax=Ditylenchus dipsaci TaxID=166011 RepID=A0A915EEX4_9BILA
MLDRLNVEVNEDCTYQIFYTKSWARNDKRPFLTTLVPQYLRLKQGRRLEITQRNVSQEQLDELVGGIENRFITATYACPFKLVLHIHINPVMTSNYRYGQKNSTTMEYLEVAPVTGLTFTIVRPILCSTSD